MKRDHFVRGDELRGTERGGGAVRKLVRKQPSLSFCYQDTLPKLTGHRARDHEAAVPFCNSLSRPRYHLFLLVNP